MTKIKEMEKLTLFCRFESPDICILFTNIMYQKGFKDLGLQSPWVFASKLQLKNDNISIESYFIPEV